MTNLAFILQGGMGGLLGGLMPFLLIFGVFYFLIIVPQRKRQKALSDMVATLKPGDKVVTWAASTPPSSRSRRSLCSS